jgi:hypothetical protein
MNSLGRRGEVELEKNPVDFFPTEPTDEGTCAEETLDPGDKDSSAHLKRVAS